jgi:AcrR family transcriptional regulator
MTAEASRKRMPADQRRAQIIAAARRLFARTGFDATTTREIAAEAGISDALIYRHFPDKQALLRTIVDDGIARFADMGPPSGIDLRAVPLAVTLPGLGAAFLTALDEQRDLIKLLVSQQHVLGDDTRFAAFIDAAACQLGAAIDHHHPGEAGRGYLLARGFMGSLVAFAILQLDLGLDTVRRVDPDTYLRTMATTLIAGLAATG